MQPKAYSRVEWATRKQFVQFIEAAASQLGIAVSWLSDYWVARLEHAGTVQYIQGYILPLNSATSANIMQDKVATYEVLVAAGLPAVPHYLLWVAASESAHELADRALAYAPLPLVVKPYRGETSGVDVSKATTKAKLQAIIESLVPKYRALAVSPLQEVSAEYRVVVLDGQVMLVFNKVRSGNEWRHNLKLGAKAALVTDPALVNPLRELAVTAMQAVGGRIAAVDIVATPHGYKVLEINGAFALNYFGVNNPQHAALAHEVYVQALRRSFGL